MKRLFFVLLISNSLVAQKLDSIPLILFDKADLNITDSEPLNNSLAADKLDRSPEAFSGEIIIISGTDIRKLGYSTLGDVLKTIPGIITSQPGNAYEGETFLVRGLEGNQHMQFMINGMPIKPEAVQGMPIGAQLPIRHALRIEIILGPSSVSYGVDCMSGIINIVLPTVLHPIYAWGDINVASPSTSSFNLSLGGKAGKGKNLFNYQLFASSFQANRTEYANYYSTSVDTNKLTSTQKNLASLNENGSAIIDDLPRISRTMGGHFKLHRVELMVMTMRREEHSGLGMNPLLQSYHDKGLTIGENISSFVFTVNGKKKANRKAKTSFSYLYYEMLPESSYYGTMHALSNGRNYMYAKSNDFYINHYINRQLSSNLKIAYGTIFTAGLSTPFINYIAKVDEKTNTSNNHSLAISNSPGLLAISMLKDTVQTIDYLPKLGAVVFTQGEYVSRSGNFRGEGGSNITMINGSTHLLPKLGFVYSPIKHLRVNLRYEKSIRTPQSYYMYNNYLQSETQYRLGNKLTRRIHDLKPEKINGVEAAVQLKVNNNHKIIFQYFGHVISNKLYKQVYVFDSTKLNPYNLVGFGYYNSTEKSILNSFSFGSQGQINILSTVITYILAYHYSIGKEYLYSVNDISISHNQFTPYRNVPNHLLKTVIDFKYKSLLLSFRGNFYGKFVSTVERNNETLEYSMSTGRNFNVDVFLCKQLFRQLNLFVSVTNLLRNAYQMGIPYEDISSVWKYNPQLRREIKCGLTFNLN